MHSFTKLLHIIIITLSYSIHELKPPLGSEANLLNGFELRLEYVHAVYAFDKAVFATCILYYAQD